MANLKNTNINDNLELPSGSTAQRPSSPSEGMIRYNTDLETAEFWNGSNWRPLSDTHPEAEGGTVIDTDIGGVPYRIHYFTETGTDTLTVTNPGEVEYLIVAGGGGGGSTDLGTAIGAGGGGAGGLLQGSTTVSAQSYTVTVGAGGAADPGTPTGTNGGNSTAFGLTALGGGGGGNRDAQDGGADGGSGGGGAFRGGTPGQALQPGSADGGFGNNGGSGNNADPYGSGGGGGGAGSRGRNSTSQSQIGPDEDGGGGHGIQSLITGSNQFYAGGGAGGLGRDDPDPAPVLPGGLGGGANGQRDNTEFEDRTATPNTGGGAGGAMSSSRAGSNQDGGDGGSGIVIVRYPRNSSLDTEPDRTTTASQPGYQSIQDGLVLNLDASFHSADSNTIKDLSGRGNDGILINNPSATSNSITLNGSDQRIVIPFSSDFELQQFTIEYVVQPLEKTHVRPFVNRSDSENQVRPWRILMVNPGGEFVAFQLSINSNVTVVNSDSPFSIDRATVIHAIYDGSEQAMWIDGVKQQQTNSVSGTPTTTKADIEIGRNSHYDPDRFANQRMFALRIYNKPLTSLEISKNFEYNRKRFTGF